MTLPLVGNPISLDDLKAELGGTYPLNLTDYYGTMPGIPSGLNNAPISLEDFYGKTFLVVEIITENTIWTPINKNAAFIHIFAVGAGGSGGVGWPSDDFTDGVAGGSGGGAGGVAYSKLVGTTVGQHTITVGVGGTGTGTTQEDTASWGNWGSATTVVGTNVNMSGNGGGAGRAGRNTDGGATSIDIDGAPGGVATGGTESNFIGGASGSVSINADGAVGAASGGGAPAFSAAHDSQKNSSNVTTTTVYAVGAGRKVSLYSTWPSILTTFPISRSQSPVLSNSILTFDASDGRIGTSTRTTTPVFGAGSGGSASQFNPASGNGGNGVVIIVYEIL